MATGRRRAALACNYCRRRKRRCNGEIPCCRLCEEVGEECVYNEKHSTRPRGPSSSSEFVRRLDAIENYLWSHTPSPPVLNHSQQHIGDLSFVQPAAAHDGTSVHDNVCASRVNPSNALHLTTNSSFIAPAYEIPPMSIPIGHTTTNETLLHSKTVKLLFGEFPQDLFLRTESARHIPHGLSLTPHTITADELPILDETQTRPLVDAFFRHVHVEMPILNRVEFSQLLDRSIKSGLEPNCESALCLVVLALGCASLEQADQARTKCNDWVPGAAYISPALRILVHEHCAAFQPSLDLPRGLILASKYFGFLLRPLQSWKLVHMASTSIQYLNSRHAIPTGSDSGAGLILLAWAAFDTECDLIAEYHLPRSGIEHAIDLTPFPVLCDNDAEETHLFLAELAIRRLLNRVHHTMYGNDWTRRLFGIHPTSNASPPYDFHSLSTILNVSRELHRQLETWYDLLPETIKPNITDPSACSPSQLIMLHRLCSAKDIILRPFLLCAIELPPEADVPPMVLEQCKHSLANCRVYLDISVRRLSTPTFSAEMIIDTILSSNILLTLGSICPLLASLVPDIDALQVKAIAAVERFAVQGSSAEEMYFLMRLLCNKTQLLRRAMELP